MKKTSRIVSGFLTVLFAGNLSAQQATRPGGVIAGHVYCADTQAPCRFASVNVESVITPGSQAYSLPSAPSHAYVGISDISGAFEIKNIPPGTYYVLGGLHGYLNPYNLAVSEFGSRASVPLAAIDAVLPRITVEPARRSTFDLTLYRAGSLGGTVRYDDGSYGINLGVALFRQDGEGILQPYNIEPFGKNEELAPLGISPHTDDRGRFYISGIPKGNMLLKLRFPL